MTAEDPGASAESEPGVAGEEIRAERAQQLEASGITVVRGETTLSQADDELPVVARLVVEIRSDGSRTIARGAMEEHTLGQRVAIEARAGTPQELTTMLLKSLLATPAITGKVVKDMLVAKGRGLRKRLRNRLLPGPRDGSQE